MRKIEKAFALIMSLVMCLAVVGCNGDKGTVSKVRDGDNSQGSDTDPYAGIEEYEGTTIKFATWIDHSKSEAARVLSSFEEKYGIKVEMVPVNQGDYVTKVAGLIASSASPDIVVNNSKTPSVYSLLQPLNQVSSVNLNDDFWDKTVLEAHKFNNNTYLLNSKYSPQNYRSLVIYNEKLFEDNGFKSPGEFYDEGNWTVDTMVECATRIARLGSDYVGLSAIPSNFSAMYGVNLIGYENGKYVNNAGNEKLQQAYKWAISCAEKGIFTYKYMSWKFNKNLVGMELASDWQLRANGAYAQNGVDPDIIGYVPLPKITKDSEQLSTLSNRAYGICKGSANSEAAGYFLRYFLDYENYDDNEMFQSEKAAKMFKTLREIDCKTIINFEDACLNSYYGESMEQTVYDDILGGGSAQFAVNLQKFKSELQSVVDSCNEMLEDIE